MEKVLPKGWVETTFGFINQKSSTKNINPFAYPDETFELYSVPIFDEAKPEIVKGSEIKSSKQIVEETDILVCKINPRINRVWNVGNFTKNRKIASSEWIVINNKSINSNFLRYQFQSQRFRMLLQSEVSGVGGSLTRSRPKLVNEYPVYISPLAEQERIVSKLDALFKKISLIEDKITALKDLKNKFFAAIFFNNSGNTTLEGLIEECKGRVGKDWKEYPKIGVSAKDGIIDLATGLKDTFENYKVVMPGDIIYNTMRINIGSIAIYNGEVPAITSPDYVVLRTKGISNHLFLNFIKSDLGRMNLSSVTTGSVRSRLYFKNLITLSYPIIDDKKQLQADNILKWFDGTIKSLDLLSKNKLSFLKNSLLLKAFKGELVPQLPTDGDAKELLAEIMRLKKNKKRGIR
ncbi:restriction endonuclease subunit S [Sphingobacterium anhuiense]|uniref:restriction endonuclease subunit S n=1 Tax=Sphingobacterium anhuiense TaxID=493780 RepID=UPI003C2C42B0